MLKSIHSERDGGGAVAKGKGAGPLVPREKSRAKGLER